MKEDGKSDSLIFDIHPEKTHVLLCLVQDNIDTLAKLIKRESACSFRLYFLEVNESRCKQCGVTPHLVKFIEKNIEKR